MTAAATYIVEIDAWHPEKIDSGYGKSTIWYRRAGGNGNAWVIINARIGGFDNPARLLDYILSLSTDYVRSAWFMIETGSAMRAVRMTTVEAVARRLKA